MDFAMPWNCPACGIQIHHGPIETRPRPGHRYRCHVCRLELVADERTEKMTVAPFDAEDNAPSPPQRSPLS